MLWYMMENYPYESLMGLGVATAAMIMSTCYRVDFIMPTPGGRHRPVAGACLISASVMILILMGSIILAGWVR